MKNTRVRSSRRGRKHWRLWPSLLLGGLLALFAVALLYTGYLFVSWGRAVAAEAPDMPALSLPKLVRAAPPRPQAAAQPQDVLAQPLVQAAQNPAPATSGRVTILIMGVDNRPDEPVARTDTILLLTLNPKTGSAGMLSLPRDMLVHSSALNRDVKINTLHVLGEINKFPGGGPALLTQTVSELIGYPIDYYARVNFDGFRQIIDLVGGVDVDVPKDIRDPEYPAETCCGFDPLFIPAGRHHMDGALALKYVRTRHADSDYGRAARQQQVILALKDRVMQPGELPALLPRLPGLALAFAKTVQTDMPADKAIGLVRNLGQVDLNQPARVVVDASMGRYVANDPKYGDILIPDMNKLRAAADAVFADTPAGDVTAATPAAAEPAPVTAPRVLVLNGSPEEGLAARASALLTADGFNVIGVGNAERADYTDTWLVLHGSLPFAARDALVRRFGVTAGHIRTDANAADADVTLILGADQAKRPSSGN